MIQPVENSRPVYSAVNIHITKPEVNAKSSEQTTISNDNGIYNSVKIDIENPRINTEPQSVYDYPENNEVVTYDMLTLNPVDVPKGLPVASYYESSVKVPADDSEEIEFEEADEDEANTDEDIDVEIPAPNYTTVESEKDNQTAEEDAFVSNVQFKAAPVEAEKDLSNVQFKAAPEPVEKKTPEIVPAEDIKPDVDISKVVSNLESRNFDEQALQIEEIARVSLDDTQKAQSYIVKDVFTKLIEIVNQDNTNLPVPTEKQINARKKVIANFIAIETAKEQNRSINQIPFEMTEEDINLANELSPMEQAERNKAYAIYAISILSKIYVDEIQNETGNIVPFTDIPGISDTVNVLRYSQNPAVKAAAIDGLRHIQRPEYKEELNTIFYVAQNDKSPAVAETATRALQSINQE